MNSRSQATFDRVGNWFFGAQPIDSMVFARIIFGLVLFFSYLSLFEYVPFLFGPQGLAGEHWIHPDRTLPAAILALAAAVPAPTDGLTGLESRRCWRRNPSRNAVVT